MQHLFPDAKDPLDKAKEDPTCEEKEEDDTENETIKDNRYTEVLRVSVQIHTGSNGKCTETEILRVGVQIHTGSKGKCTYTQRF